MMHRSHVLLFALSFALVVSCKKDSEPEQASPVLTTNPVQNLTGTTATLGGDISSVGSDDVYARGVCWSFNSNPTLNDNSSPADGSGLGSFSVNVTNLNENTSYNYRAYAINNYGIGYGNNITFTTGSAIQFSEVTVTNIEAKRAVISAAVISSTVSVGSRGIVWSTSPNPNNQDLIYSPGTGVGEIEVSIIQLAANTTYYIRTYAISLGAYSYGPELSFNTVGYPGPAGGIVSLDKGNDTGGWRYLESNPAGTIYNTWGCTGTLIGGTSAALGQGPSNTTIIMNGCSSSNCAARICANYSYNGFTDWFLPSSQECISVFRSVEAVNSSLINTNYLVTSTELNSNDSEEIYYNSGNPSITSEYKSNSSYFMPVRRY
jgi:hypothetical protein